jgi:hypothetical protein
MEGCCETLSVESVTAIDQKRRLCPEFALVREQEMLHRLPMSGDQLLEEVRQNTIVRHVNCFARTTGNVRCASVILNLDA